MNAFREREREGKKEKKKKRDILRFLSGLESRKWGKESESVCVCA